MATSLIETEAAEEIRFNRDVRPLLSEHCFQCHGFDANTRKSSLRLDLREEALKPAKSGAIPLIPGKMKLRPRLQRTLRMKGRKVRTERVMKKERF